TAQPSTLALSADDGVDASVVRFRMYSNYPRFIARSEIRIFEHGQSSQAVPLEVVEVGPEGVAEWRPGSGASATPMRELQYVLRVYDAEGRFDETAPQPLWIVRGSGNPGPVEESASAADHANAGSESAARPQADGLLAGYGETGPLLRNIPLGGVGTVKVHGSAIPPQHTVWFAGEPVPVDEHGNFVAEAILPSGLHTVEVAVLDPEGNGELFLRDLELEHSGWFYVGMADLTLAGGRPHGPANAPPGANTPPDPSSLADGRLAFFVNGRFHEDWKLTASADTREEPVQNLFTNFLDKSPESLFRRMDPDYHYPTFGDDGSVEEAAPTSGKFFVRLQKDENQALWGNFKVGYVDNELALVGRGLYGANLHSQTPATTSFGERRLVLDGFAADPGTMPSREEFRGTGGSLYFLHHQDVLVGSERVRIEIRDKDSGIVTGVVQLRPEDYDIDYLQGRIMLATPVDATVSDKLLVRSEGLSGDESWLVVQYEFTPGFNEPNVLAAGGQGESWLNDFVKVGVTANRNDEGDTQSSLYGANLTLRKSADSWLKLQTGHSEGLVSTSLRSDDGGFRFLGTPAAGLDDARAGAYRADASLGFGDLFDGAKGRVALYAQRLDAGYSASGLTTLTDTDQIGGVLGVPVGDRMQLAAKADGRIQQQGLETTAEEVDVGYRL